jgi:hypothetical protein
MPSIVSAISGLAKKVSVLIKPKNIVGAQEEFLD